MSTTSGRKRAAAPQAESEEHLARVLDNAADMARRKIYLCGEIDEFMAYRFMVALQTLDERKGPITVILNTPGGVCEEGFAIYDAVQYARNPVYIVGFGQVASMGSIIMQAGTKRMLSAECDFMIHDVAISSAPGGMSLKDVTLLNHNLQRMQRRGNRILAKHSGQPEEQIVKWCREETTFSAAQAVECGFADTVLKRNKEKIK